MSRSGIGSRLFNGRRPGLPSMSLRPVGFGLQSLKARPDRGGFHLRQLCQLVVRCGWGFDPQPQDHPRLTWRTKIMPKIKVNDITINYEQHGTGEPLLLIPYLAADNACYAF